MKAIVIMSAGAVMLLLAQAPRADVATTLQALDGGQASAVRGARQDQQPVHPIYEYCDPGPANPICQLVFGDLCSPGDETCAYCQVSPDAVYRKCKTQPDPSQCNRGAGGGIVSCGVRFRGTCDEDGNCNATSTGDACNSAGNLKHECG